MWEGEIIVEVDDEVGGETTVRDNHTAQICLKEEKEKGGQPGGGGEGKPPYTERGELFQRAGFKKKCVLKRLPSWLQAVKKGADREGGRKRKTTYAHVGPLQKMTGRGSKTRIRKESSKGREEREEPSRRMERKENP